MNPVKKNALACKQNGQEIYYRKSGNKIHLLVALITSKKLLNPLLLSPTYPQQERLTTMKRKWSKLGF